jgi:hypothetical protein
MQPACPARQRPERDTFRENGQLCDRQIERRTTDFLSAWMGLEVRQ